MIKKPILIILTILCIASESKAQDSLTCSRYFQRIVKLICQDSIADLAQLIDYPLKRENPVPDITTPKEFILYSPILFDSAFKRKLASYNDSNIFQHEGVIGLGGGHFSGDIWLDEDGKIKCVNYQSAEELKLQQRLVKETKNIIHKSVNMWKKNYVTCETDKFIIRVDLMDDDDLRYVAWSKPKKISDAPDIVLFNGAQEFQGTMGGVTYTFENHDYYYRVDQKDLAPSDRYVGLFLRIYKSKKDLENAIPLVSYKCSKLK
jgi:hypothetical protein